MTDEEFKETIRKEVQKALSVPLEKEWVCSCGQVVLKPDENPSQNSSQNT